MTILTKDKLTCDISVVKIKFQGFKIRDNKPYQYYYPVKTESQYVDVVIIRTLNQQHYNSDGTTEQVH